MSKATVADAFQTRTQCRLIKNHLMLFMKISLSLLAIAGLFVLSIMQPTPPQEEQKDYGVRAKEQDTAYFMASLGTAIEKTPLNILLDVRRAVEAVDGRMTLNVEDVTGLGVRINGQVTNNSDYLTWDWGDSTLQHKGWFSQEHTYAQPGKYTITVTAYKKIGERFAVTARAKTEVVVSPATKTSSCGFYNQIVIPDPVGDATPGGAPLYVDIRNLTVRQIGDNVQFVWEAGGNMRNEDQQYFFLVFDTDFDPNTGQNWGGAGGELKIRVYNNSILSTYFSQGGSTTRELEDLGTIVYENRRFVLTYPINSIPAQSFNFYFQSSGGTPYLDRGSLVGIDLLPAQLSRKLTVTLTDPSSNLINILTKGQSFQLQAFVVVGGVVTPAYNTRYIVTHPVHDTNPNDIITINNFGYATYRGEGYVSVTAYSPNCYLKSDPFWIANGKLYPGNDVVAVFPEAFIPVGSQYSFGNMMISYPAYMRMVNLQYAVTRNLYGGFEPYNGLKQILALFNKPNHCGGNNNPMEIAPCCYMNCGGNLDGTPNYKVYMHELGHNFGSSGSQSTTGTQQLLSANDFSINNAGFGECIASLPLIYFATEMARNPTQYGFTTENYEWRTMNDIYERDRQDVPNTLANFENLIATGQTTGIHDQQQPPPFDGVSVMCSFFQMYSLNLLNGPNPYKNSILPRFLHFFGDREPPGFVPEKVDTYFAAAFSAAVGGDVRYKFRYWGFNIDNVYFNQVYPRLVAELQSFY